jgi:bifunctional non-homologous end joining protein LigD
MFNGRGTLQLVSRNGFDRTVRFRAPFGAMLSRIRHELVIDGELAVPDDRGVSHIEALQEAIVQRQPARLAFFAFDLVHFDGHDLRRCRIEERKAWLEDVLGGATQGSRVVYVDHVIGYGTELFARVQEIGAEGIVSKRLGSQYRAGRSADWLKTKVCETGEFVISGFVELAGSRLDAIAVAEMTEPGALVPRGLVKFGLAGKGLWEALDMIRAGPASRSGVVPVKPMLITTIRCFGRYKSSGAIRDGVLIGMPRLLEDHCALPNTRR